MSSEGERGHLLMGMVLADVFLLVLLVVWWGYKNEATDPLGVVRMRQELVALTEKVKQLEAKNSEFEAMQAKYERMREQLRRLAATAGSPNADLDGISVGEIVAALRRGAAACSSGGVGNVAVRVFAREGQHEIRIMSATFVADLAAVSGGPSLDVGSTLRGSEIDRLLSLVQSLYGRRKADGRECRYDYTLVWQEDASYRSARERFERYFYPAGITRGMEAVSP